MEFQQIRARMERVVGTQRAVNERQNPPADQPERRWVRSVADPFLDEKEMFDRKWDRSSPRLTFLKNQIIHHGLCERGVDRDREPEAPTDPDEGRPDRIWNGGTALLDHNDVAYVSTERDRG